METILLDFGFGWTWSKLLPYILFLLIGIIGFLILRKKMNSRILKWISSLVILIPFGIYFSFKPIFEGDFSNSFTTRTNVPDSLSIDQGKLIVISIANCPFCAESIGLLKQIRKRSNYPQIEFKVLTSDSSLLVPYKESANGELMVSQELRLEAFSNLAENSFPTFIYKKGNDLMIWSNDNFGTRAIDWIEKEIIVK